VGIAAAAVKILVPDDSLEAGRAFEAIADTEMSIKPAASTAVAAIVRTLQRSGISCGSWVGSY
jgi:hypothetical protein